MCRIQSFDSWYTGLKLTDQYLRSAVAVRIFGLRHNSSRVGSQHEIVANPIGRDSVRIVHHDCGGGLPNPRDKERKEEIPRTQPTIVFMTDFGTANDSVAILQGGHCWNRTADPHYGHHAPSHTIFDRRGRAFSAGVTPYYPSGTVFLAVIDPGVGTSRKALIVKSKKGNISSCR